MIPLSTDPGLSQLVRTFEEELGWNLMLDDENESYGLCKEGVRHAVIGKRKDSETPGEVLKRYRLELSQALDELRNPEFRAIIRDTPNEDSDEEE